jgi:CBS domain-containing protein
VQDLLPRRQDRDELPVVDPDATTLEVAAVMVQMHSPIVAVVDESGQLLGAVTLSRLFEVLFPAEPSA